MDALNKVIKDWQDDLTNYIDSLSDKEKLMDLIHLDYLYYSCFQSHLLKRKEIRFIIDKWFKL